MNDCEKFETSVFAVRDGRATGGFVGGELGSAAARRQILERASFSKQWGAV